MKSTSRTLRRTTGIILLTVSITYGAKSLEAEQDQCGWGAYAISAGIMGGFGYLAGPGAADMAAMFTAAAATYAGMDYLQIPCPPATQDLPCQDSLGGCDDSGGPGDGNGTGTTSQPDQDDGSQS